MGEVVFNRASLRAAELSAYEGIALADVTLVDSPALADEALAALLATDVIGFDTESKPTFRKGEQSTGPHLVQLALETRVYLFRISRLPATPALKAILESPRVLKVGFGLGNDLSVLKSKLDIDLNHFIDLGEVLRSEEHPGTVGAKVAVAHFFAARLQKSKKIGTSNWASDRLAERQLLYAANDAQVALRVYRAWAPGGEGPRTILSQPRTLSAAS
jgi:RNA polymerase sigma factor for flagellar operon FliA